MATTLLMSYALINLRDETAMEANQRILREHFDISAISAERIAGAMEDVGIGKIESISTSNQHQSFFTFFVIDDKSESYHLTVRVDGSLATIFKDGAGGDLLWGKEE